MAYVSLLILAISHFIVDMYIGFLMPLLPALEISMNVSFAALAGLVGFLNIVVNLLQPLVARFSRYFPPHLFLFLGPAVSGIMAFIGVIDSFEAFAVISLISVIGTAIFHPEGVIAAHVASGEHEHIGVPFFLSGGFFGFSGGALISSQWFTNYGFSNFWLLLLPGVIFSVLLLLIRKNIAPAHEPHSESTKERIKERDKDSGKKFHILLLVCLGFVLVTPVAVTYTLYSKSLEQIYGETIAIEWSGLVLALLGLFGAGSSYFWGWLSRKHSPYLLTAISQGAAIIIFMVFINTPPGWGLLVITLVLAVCWGSALFPVIATAARTARGLNATERAGWMVGGSWGFGGIFQMIFGLGTEVGLELPLLVQLPVLFMVAGMILALYMWRKSVAYAKSAEGSEVSVK